MMKVFLTSLLRFTKGRASDKSILRQSQPLQHVLSNPNSAILVITLAMIVVHASIGVNQPLYMASFFFSFLLQWHKDNPLLQSTGPERQNPSLCSSECSTSLTEIFAEYKTDLFLPRKIALSSSLRVLLLIMNGGDMLL